VVGRPFAQLALVTFSGDTGREGTSGYASVSLKGDVPEYTTKRARRLKFPHVLKHPLSI
jgi:hypothetical protein